MLSASACEAKEASAGMFDIVFLDISLPDGNGLSLLPLLLGSEGHPEVIMITGHDNRDWLEQALMAGAWDFIRKDDSLDTVFAALEQALLYHQNRCGAQLSSSGQRTTPLKRNRLVWIGCGHRPLPGIRDPVCRQRCLRFAQRGNRDRQGGFRANHPRKQRPPKRSLHRRGLCGPSREPCRKPVVRACTRRLHRCDYT